MIISIDVSQEIFAINVLRILKSSLKHRRKHVLRPIKLYGDQALEKRRIDVLMLKIWHYLSYKVHYFYLCVQRKTNAFLDAYGNFWKFQEVSESRNMLRLIHMCPATESGRSEGGPFVIDDYFL